VFGGAFEVAIVVVGQRGCHVIMIASFVGSVLQSGGEVTASAFEFTAFQLKFSEASLRQFGDVGGQFPEAGQLRQQPHGLAESALLLTTGGGGEQMFDEIQGCVHHDTASLQYRRPSSGVSAS
jgi:hypothetical protein